MKNKIILLTILVAFFTISGTASAACVKSGDSIVTKNGSETPVNNGLEETNECSDTPDEYKMDFYKIGMCRENPQNGSEIDLSSCEFILDSVTGVSHAIINSAESAVNVGDFTIPSATYPYNIVVLSNKIGIKHSFQTTNNTSGIGGGEGKYCSTTSGRIYAYTSEQFTSIHGFLTAPGTMGVTCGTSTPSAGYNYTVINMLQGEECSETFAQYGERTAMGNVGNGNGTISLLKTDNTSATNCSNAGRIAWSTALTTPIVVTDTSQFVLSVKKTLGSQIVFSEDEDNAVMSVRANPFQMHLGTI